MLESLARSIAASDLSTSVMSSVWLWPVMEIIHFIGLSLMLGALIITDLRLAGYIRAISLSAAHSLLPWVFIGFGLNLVSGIVFIIGDPLRYAQNTGFLIKILLMFIAAINAAWFLLKLQPIADNLDENADTPPVIKLVAYISLICWTGVLLLGRLIPYVSNG